jgi:hypothetical protein
MSAVPAAMMSKSRFRSDAAGSVRAARRERRPLERLPSPHSTGLTDINRRATPNGTTPCCRERAAMMAVIVSTFKIVGHSAGELQRVQMSTTILHCRSNVRRASKRHARRSAFAESSTEFLSEIGRQTKKIAR